MKLCDLKTAYKDHCKNEGVHTSWKTDQFNSICERVGITLDPRHTAQDDGGFLYTGAWLFGIGFADHATAAALQSPVMLRTLVGPE